MRAAILLCFFLCGLIPAAEGATAKAIVLQRIDIQGNHITSRRIILRELPVVEGQRFAPDSISYLIDIARQRLINLGLFTTVDIRTSPDGEEGIRWEIVVHERWYIMPKPVFQLADRNFNVWWKEMDRDIRRINVGLKVTDNNFRGNMESLSILAQAGYTQALAIEYVRPYIDKAQRHGIGAAVSVAQSGEQPYATDSNKLQFARLPGTHIIRQYDANVSWFYRPAYALRHSLSLGYHHADISDTLLQLNGEYFGNSRSRLRYADITYRVDYNGVDNWNYPMRGFKSVNHVIVRKGLEGMGWQGQLRTETGIFKPLGNKFYGQAIFRGRLSLPNDVPYFLQSALGTKTDYVRGYEYYVVNGTHYGLLRFDLKYELFNRVFRKTGFRFLPELPLRFYPKVFADAGAARNPYPGNSFLNDRMLYSAGIGGDIVSAYDFKLRIEAALNHLGQYGVYLHLNSE